MHAALRPHGLPRGKLDGRGVASGEAAQERPGAKENMEGMAVGVLNVVEGREVEYIVVEKGYVVVGVGVWRGVSLEDIVATGLFMVQWNVIVED
jgi:hypothetical protein